MSVRYYYPITKPSQYAWNQSPHTSGSYEAIIHHHWVTFCVRSQDWINQKWLLHTTNEITNHAYIRSIRCINVYQGLPGLQWIYNQSTSKCDWNWTAGKKNNWAWKQDQIHTTFKVQHNLSNTLPLHHHAEPCSHTRQVHCRRLHSLPAYQFVAPKNKWMTISTP